jgi:hypothetical protein
LEYKKDNTDNTHVWHTSRVVLREHSCLKHKPCRVEGTSLSRFLFVVTKNVQKSKRTIVKSMKSTYGIYCNIIPLETCNEICICTKTWLRKHSECTSYSTTEFHWIIFYIDQDVILTWQIIKYTSVIVYCRYLIDRNKCLHKNY